jgi:heme-degrading monooxygenase HmoA
MFARVSTYQGETERLLEGFRRTTDPLAQLEGFERAYFLVAAAGHQAMSITLWDSEAAMAASAEWANRAREHAAHDSGATVESVATYEVALSAERRAVR